MGLFFPRLPEVGRPERPLLSLTGAAAAHAALIALIAVVVPAEELKQAIRPIAVRLIEILPDAPKPPPKPPQAPKQTKLPPAQALLSANVVNDAPAAFAVPPQPPAPPQAAPIMPVAAPVAITAARFDADYLDNPKPVYPHAARRLGEQGKVLLRVHVSADGHAERVEIKVSSGFARLDQAAEDAVSRWRFVPARRGDQAIAAWVQVPVTFQLES